MLRSSVVLAAASVLALSACAGPAATPASSPASSVVATASPTAAPTVTATPAASAAPTATPIVIRPGEPWLVFAWFPNSLFLVRPDGSDRHRLEIGVEGEPFAPSWSPDGARIAFVMRDAKTPNGSIWTAAADGSGAALLYDGNGECDEGAFWPVWSPDGTRLAMVCYYVKGTTSFEAISVLDPATKVRTDVATLEGSDPVDNPISWSPDGSTLAFEILTWDPADTLVTGSLVATVPAAGGTVHRLTDPKLFASHPDWSPDGRLIAFNTYDTGNIHGIGQPSNVYAIAPDGSGMRQLSTASTDGTMRLGQPFWSSDGSRIWVSVGRDWEKDSTGQFKNTLGWVDAATGAFHEIGTEGKRFRERPAP
jgi:Tol biopolymer transport system component